MKSKFLKWASVVVGLGIVAGSALALYLLFMPHRDVQSTMVDFHLHADALVNEYLNDAQSADDKYLNSNGDSKVLAVSGRVFSIETDFNNQKVVVLRGEGSPAGVSCTFLPEAGEKTEQLATGDWITVKGVIRSGAVYDPDLGLTEDVILEKCDIPPSI